VAASLYEKIIPGGDCGDLIDRRDVS